MDPVVYLIALVGGLLSPFTPCSLVMIPSFISFVGIESTSMRRGFLLSMVYGLGFALVFAGPIDIHSLPKHTNFTFELMNF